MATMGDCRHGRTPAAARSTILLMAMDEAGLVNLANANPLKALRMVDSLLAGDDREALAAAVHLRIRAIASRNMGDLEGASEAITQAILLAEEARDQRLLGLARMTNAPIQMSIGDSTRALEEIGEAIATLRGRDLAEAKFQRGSMRLVMADFAAARSDFDEALGEFSTDENLLWEADALLNRGSVEIYLGRTDHARRDLTAAAERFDLAGDRIGHAMAGFNLAIATQAGGEPIRALAEFDQAIMAFSDLDYPADHYRAEQCESMLAVGRYSDVARLSVPAIETLDQAGDRPRAVRQRLVAAQALLASGAHQAALAFATQARDVLVAQDQPTRAAHAETLCCEIALAGGFDPSWSITSRLEAAASKLRAARARDWLESNRLVAATALLSDGQVAKARTMIRDQIASDRSPDRLVGLWLLLAQLESDVGDGPSALRACRSAVRRLRELEQLAAPAEVRAALSMRLPLLRTIAVRLLIERGKAREALLFVEASRTSTFRSSALVSREEVAQRRAIAAALSAAEPGGLDHRKLQHRLHGLEIRIWASRLQAGSAAEHKVDKPRLQSVLPVVTFVPLDDELQRIDLRSGRVSSGHIGSVESVIAEATALREKLERVWAHPTGTVLEAEIRAHAAAIDSELGGAGDGGPEESRLALCSHVPGPEVISGHLPSLKDRKWVRSLTPIEGCHRSTSDGPALLVCGPGLETAKREVAELRHRYPNHVMLRGRNASVERTLVGLDGASVAHIAAHSTLDAESPMFSSIELADGPLYLHELEHLHKAPSIVVLATCGSATNQTVGTMQIGIANVLLELGVGAVIGSICDLPDDIDTRRIMRRLHNETLLEDPAAALATVVSDETLTNRQRLISRSLLVCTSHSSITD